MLIFTSIDLLPYIPNKENVIIANLSSYNEQYERIALLPPIGVDYDSKEFDLMYANFLLSDRIAFGILINLINQLVNNRDVILLVTFDDGGANDAYMESLEKFILCRYGYSSCIVRDMDDIDYLNTSNVKSYFTVEGIQNADKDIQTLVQISMQDPNFVYELERMERSSEYLRSTYIH